MQDLSTRRATYADLEAAPPNMVAELIDGKLVTMPRPAPRNMNAGSGLGYFLQGPFHRGIGGPGGWWIIDEPEIHLAEDVVVPDLAGWRRERMPELPSIAFFPIAPDWICEVLSPSTARYDRGAKRDIYARHGVSHYWLLDPAQKLLEAFDLAGDKWLLQRTYRDGDTVAMPPFDAAPFALAQLWV